LARFCLTGQPSPAHFLTDHRRAGPKRAELARLPPLAPPVLGNFPDGLSPGGHSYAVKRYISSTPTTIFITQIRL